MQRSSFAPTSKIPLNFRLWIVAAVLAGLPSISQAQTFSLDLSDVTEIYEQYYPQLMGAAAWDTTAAFDFRRVPIGNQRFKARHFLKSNFGEFRVVREYHELFLATYIVPSTYSFVLREKDGGEFFEYVPRDFDTPGLIIRIVPIDEYYTGLYERSQRAIWNEITVEIVSAAGKRSKRAPSRGVNINIPLPMPRQLESIFGPSDKTHINLSGRESITFAGETRRVSPFIGVEGRENQSLFPSLDMNQELDVSLKGTIGDKVNVEVNHSSQEFGNNANRVNVNYVGYEDDVIQLVELGSTSLSLPGSQLISFSAQSKGLFGIKVLAKLGPTDITFIASKQEGEGSSASFSPTSGSIGRREERVILDIDYVKDRYFYFDTPFPDGVTTFSYAADDSFDLELFRSVRPFELSQDSELNTQKVWAFADPSGLGDGLSDGVLDSNVPRIDQFDWKLLTPGEDYSFIIDVATNDYIGIVLARSIENDRALAVRYTPATSPPGTFTIGGPLSDPPYNDPGASGDPGTETNPIIAELLKPPDARPTGEYGSTWELMMRNYYFLGMSNIDYNTLDIQIEDNFDNRETPSFPVGSGEPYIRIFGLDQYDSAGKQRPDGQIDNRLEIIDLRRGILRFPVDRGFSPEPAFVDAWTDSFSFSDPRYSDQHALSRTMYDDYLSLPRDAHQYRIKVTAVSAATTFRLDAFNIIEGSEVVNIDGRQLTRNIDYTIDYTTGEIQLKSTVTVSPTSRIRIDYEFKPFGGSTSSSLVGVAANAQLSSDSRVGGSLLYESKTTDAVRPRLGEEPTRAIVGGVHGTYQHQSRMLTDLANKLPFVDTDAPSSLTVSGEIAASLPDPNTRGETYIDDFEGTEDSDLVSLSRASWYPASPPLDSIDVALNHELRHGFIWYNIESERAPRKRDFNPILGEREGDDVVPSIDIEVDGGALQENWVGLMAGFGSGGLDITQGQFIEIWVNDFKEVANRTGTLRIDLGTLDEDFYEPGLDEWNDEDKSRDGFQQVVDDSGLDGEWSPNDNGQVPLESPPESGFFDPDDPAGDDIETSRINGRYSKINGTEANLRYDTEDLDANGLLSTTSTYFSYIIDLANTPTEEDIPVSFPEYGRENHENDSWRLYRIPLSDFLVRSDTGSQPHFDQIRHIRLWFDDPAAVSGEADDGRRRFQIAGLKIQGNRWIPDGVRDKQDKELDDPGDTEFKIGVISNKTHPSVYDPPIRPNEQNGIFDKESSLAFQYFNVKDTAQVRIRKEFEGNGINFSQYRDLNMWVHTDPATRDADLEYYIRIATSRDHFYEFILPFKSEFFKGSGWSRILIKLTDLTNLKFGEPDSSDARGAVLGFATDLVETDRKYPLRMVGSPSLFTVRFLYCGVRNVGPPGSSKSGEVWINDIYLGDVRRDPDIAARASLNMNVAGVVTFSSNYSIRGPDFRGLRERRGAGSQDQQFSMNGKTDVRHFLPLAGFSIPISGTYSRSEQQPKFVPSSDIEIIDAADRDSLSTVTVRRSFSTALAKRSSRNRLLKYSIDKMTTNFSYGITERKSPSSRDTTDVMRGAVGYNINWVGKRNVTLFNRFKMRYWLNSLSLSSSGTRNVTRRWFLQEGSFVRQPVRKTMTLGTRLQANYKPTQMSSINFEGSIDRNPAIPGDTLFGINIGKEVGRRHALRVNFQPKTGLPLLRLINMFRPNVNISSTYNENSSPSVRQPGDRSGTRNVSSSRNLSVKMRFDVGKQAEGIFRKIGWDPFDTGSPDDSRSRPKGRSQQPAAPQLRPPQPQPEPEPEPETEEPYFREPEPADTSDTGGFPFAPAASSTSFFLASAAQPPDSAGGVPFPRPQTSFADTASVPAEPPQRELPIQPPRQQPVAQPAQLDSVEASRGARDPLKFLGRVFVGVRPIDASLNHNLTNSYNRIHGRPWIPYQFGLSDDTKLSTSSGPIDNPNTEGVALTLNASTGVKITETIDLTTRYSRSVRDRNFQANKTRSISQTFPDVGIKFGSLQGIGPIERYFKRSSATIDMRVATSKSGRQGEDPSSERYALTLTPGIQFETQNAISLSMSASRSTIVTTARGSETESRSTSVTFDMRKSFSGGTGFRLPLPFVSKRVSWRSRLETNLTIAYSVSGGERRPSGVAPIEIPGTSSLRVSPNASYTFSSTLSGRTFIDFSRTHSDRTGQTTTVVRVGVNAVFTF